MTRKSSRGLVVVTYERWSFASLLGDPGADSGGEGRSKLAEKPSFTFLRAIFFLPV